MNTDDELRAKAEAATPVDWWPFAGKAGSEAHKEHYAAWSPSRALAALEVIEEARDALNAEELDPLVRGNLQEVLARWDNLGDTTSG